MASQASFRNHTDQGFRAAFGIKNLRDRVVLRYLLITLIILACVAGGFTLFAMRDGLSPTNDLSAIVRWLWIDLAILSAIAVLVLIRLAQSLRPLQRGAKGSSLLAKVTLLFSAIAIVPTVLLIIFSVSAFNLGVRAWFSAPVSTAINEAEAVANAYLHEHKQTLVVRALEIATDLSQNYELLQSAPETFNQTIDTLAFDYEINEAVVVNGRNQRLAYGGMSPLSSTLIPSISQVEFYQADQGAVVQIDGGDKRSVDAMIKLANFDEAYLYITKFVDEQIVERVERTGDAAATYTHLDEGKARFESMFLLIFFVIGLLLLLTALSFGMVFANNLTGPIRRLTLAANDLAEGDLDARVAVAARRDGKAGGDEISELSSTFNRMASRLGRQQVELKTANQKIDARRKFTEAVLSGVSAGVIGLDAKGCITLPNQSAAKLLDRDLGDAQGKPLAELAPEFAEPVKAAIQQLSGSGTAQKPIVFEEVSLKQKGSLRTFRLVIVRESGAQEDARFILTFDDITDLQLAERKAAWSDVARRIAHEIKNPLTPIQLSAERLKRRYSKQIDEGRDTFDICTDTIIRQVNDIGRMVDEFANFARTPTPEMVKADLREICEQAVFLQNNRGSDVAFEAVLPPNRVMHTFDPGLISQSVVNILKNAGEAVETRKAQDEAFRNANTKGLVRLTLTLPDEAEGLMAGPLVYVQDNGCGIPADMRTKLTEPYVTNRKKGTGLGLAIVKKILEDHGGALLVDEPVPDALQDENLDGAAFTLRLG